MTSCPACGAALLAGAPACSRCGLPLASASPSAPPSPPPPPPPPALTSTATESDECPAPPGLPGSRELVAAAEEPTRGRRLRRAWLLAGGAALLVAVAGVIALVVVLGRADPSPSTLDRRQRDAHDVALAISRLVSDPGSLRAADAVGATPSLPAGSKVTADSASWHPDGAGGGTISVIVTDPAGSAHDYVAVVVREGAAWKVLATLEGGGTPTPPPSVVAS